MFSGPNPKIERADMDGSRRKSVIIDQIFWPNGLTIDYTESKIYWADAKHHVIERAMFDGQDRKKVNFLKSLLLKSYSMHLIKKMLIEPFFLILIDNKQRTPSSVCTDVV